MAYNLQKKHPLLLPISYNLLIHKENAGIIKNNA